MKTFKSSFMFNVFHSINLYHVECSKSHPRTISSSSMLHQRHCSPDPQTIGSREEIFVWLVGVVKHAYIQRSSLKTQTHRALWIIYSLIKKPRACSCVSVSAFFHSTLYRFICALLYRGDSHLKNTTRRLLSWCARNYNLIVLRSDLEKRRVKAYIVGVLNYAFGGVGPHF